MLRGTTKTMKKRKLSEEYSDRDRDDRGVRDVRPRGSASGKSSSSHAPARKALFTQKIDRDASGPPKRQLFTTKKVNSEQSSSNDDREDDLAVVRCDNLRWDMTSESLMETFKQYGILGWKTLKVVSIHGQGSHALLEFDRGSCAKQFVKDHDQKVRNDSDQRLIHDCFVQIVLDNKVLELSVIIQSTEQNMPRTADRSFDQNVPRTRTVEDLDKEMENYWKE
jgi:hypothetical protein